MARLIVALSAGLLAASLQAAESAAICVRNADAARTWQVNLSPSEPIGWLWGEADAATLVVSNAVEKTEKSYQVSRSGDEPFGSCTIDLPSDAATCEHVLFLSLALTAEEAEVERMTARIACLPQTFSVEKPNGKSWRTLTRPRVFAYDAEWTGEPAETVGLTFKAEDSMVSLALAGVAGYDVVDVQSALGAGFSDLFRTSLTFDDAEKFVADLRFGVPGFLLLLK